MTRKSRRAKSLLKLEPVGIPAGILYRGTVHQALDFRFSIRYRNKVLLSILKLATLWTIPGDAVAR
jgi:hypothetical protein